MKSFKDLARQILREEGKPLHSKEITEKALKTGLLETAGKTPDATMYAQIIRDIEAKGPLSDFKKVGPSVFALNENKETAEEEVRPDNVLNEIESEEEAKVQGGYIGRGGEHAVLSELLFRGYNAALISVDTGIDILAIKDNETFNIQVKTRNTSKTSKTFHFNIRIASFDRHTKGKTFYIFVLKEGQELEYIILPLSELDKAIDQEFIHKITGGKIYRVNISRSGENMYLGRKENDVSYYRNRWEIIK